jgi:glycerol-1-phosphate dehydrogenase [NAD(P)+]
MTINECLAFASDTKEFRIEHSALDILPEILSRRFPGASAYIVADGNTMKAAGDRAIRILREAGIPVAAAHTYPASPVLHAHYEYARDLALMFRGKASIEGGIVPVAVGSGTINDLVKRAAMEAGISYLCVPTAASVDGYTSNGAALLDGGFKKTFACPAPLALVADPAILAAAPAYLSSSGFGDLASKLIAGTDWIIAEAAGKAGAPGCEAIDATAWSMTQDKLREDLRRSESAARGDEDAVGTLFAALAVTGFSMQYLRSSRPVSGCEHLFSHVWEMGDLSVDGVPVTHGHKVAIGTLCATALTEALFARTTPPPLDALPPLTREAREAEIRRAFSDRPAAAADAAVLTALSKLPDAASLRLRRGQLADGWKNLREHVLERLVPYGELRAMLERSFCPVVPETIGLTRTEAIATARKAQMMRNRYTALDLAWDFGILNDCLATIESEERYLR